MAQAKRDDNRVTTIIGVDEATLTTPTLVAVTTENELKTSTTIATTNEALEFATDSGDSNVLYLGTASVGTATSAASWKIQKIDTTSGVSITWADGNATADNIWDNRESLSYS
ncbi:MAG: hypothetical protein DRN81_06805 [Thermoproteota archaeon]|nr:MAG: hypothetical protein DRN81_06805 [Candidatus Korarchaeota archaeon]